MSGYRCSNTVLASLVRRKYGICGLTHGFFIGRGMNSTLTRFKSGERNLDVKISPSIAADSANTIISAQDLRSITIEIPSRKVKQQQEQEDTPKIKRKSKTKSQTKVVTTKTLVTGVPELISSDEINTSENLVIEDRGSIIDDNSYTDFYQNIIDIYKEFSKRPEGEYIVLIHVGSFYELYFEQANRFAGFLGLTLTSKTLKSGPIPFSGFPDKMLEKYMDIIYKAGYKAVVCNQVLDPVTNIISRPIDRIMTPGIILDESCRDFHRNNFLLSLNLEDIRFDSESQKVGLSWCDVNLGLFYVSEVYLNELLPTITRINPSEILVSEKLDLERLLNGSILPEFTDLKSYYFTKFSQLSQKKQIKEFHWRFADNIRLVTSTLDALPQKEKAATSLLLHYLEYCLPNYRTSFQLPNRSLSATLMQIDPRAAQDLELLETMQSRKRVGALAHLVDKTVTNPGARLLNMWLLAPSTNIDEITKRQNMVEFFLKDTLKIDMVKQLLKKTSDINRIIRRIDNGRANMYEYMELAITFEILDDIYSLLIKDSNKKIRVILDSIFSDFRNSKSIVSLGKKILKTINPKVSYLRSPTNKSEGEIIREFWDLNCTASSTLQNLRCEYDALVSRSYELQSRLKSQFSDEGYNGSIRLIKDMKTYEYIVELKSTSKCIPLMIQKLDLKTKEKSKSATKLINAEWTAIGEKMIKLEYDIVLEENIIIEDLKKKIKKLYNELKRVSPVIELVDVTQSFADLALQSNMTKPLIDNSTSFEIKNGRHIVVEEGLKHRIDVVNFTANNCKLDSSQAWVITGPNMGGKSTFLRQNALMAIMAQIGSYVPADFAHIGIVDKIFTRVGSSDNIYKHQSTFMVEMNEAAIILREATEKSLIIVDELGRGTSTNEGVAIAYATLATLVKSNKSKVLFATHFGTELTRLLDDDPSVKECISFYMTGLIKQSSNLNERQIPIDRRIMFDHKLSTGISFHSHALEIAELAGFSPEVLKLAENCYTSLNKK